MCSHRQFDKEGMWSFRNKTQKRGRTTFEREIKLVVFIKIKQNIFLEIVGGCYY